MSQYDLDSNVLMIGHSLIGPTLPWLIDAAAAAQGGNGRVDAQIINGAPLIWQWENGASAQGVNARAVLPSGNYDVVVMTEAVPLLNHLTWSDTTTYVRNYYDLAVASNPDARVYVYETWHSLNSGTGVPVQWDDEDHIPWRQRLDNDIDRWQGIVDDVNAGLAPGQPEVMLIPAGQAMALLYDRIEAGQVPGVSSINQFFSDDIHLNDLGLYFITMVQYSTIFGDDPANLPSQLPLEWGGALGPSSDALADVLQDIAWTAVTSYEGSGVDAGGGGVQLPPDFAPDALDDTATTDEGNSVAIDVLANDNDLDGAGLTVLALSDPTNGSVEMASGQIVYTPNDGFSGADSFSYTVADADGDTGTANVTVTVNGAPVVPTQSPSVDGATLTNPSLAINLEYVNDWSTQQPFLDVMKTSREWIGHEEGSWWGGFTYDDLVTGGHLDENGWLTSLPDTAWGVSAQILTDLPAETAGYTAGRYRVTYDGEGEVTVRGGGASNVQYGDGEIWFDFQPSPGPVIITVEDTDPNGTGDNIRNISVVHENNIAAFESGEIFNPLWLELIDDMRSVRFMDWMVTNNSEQSEWADRPEVDDYTWASDGVPLEIMVELANQIGVDPWFNMPHLATDEYMTEFAQYVRENLDPSLKAYVEYSNEVWNWQFEQAQWAEQQGQERWGQDNTWTQFGAARASEMAQIWRDVFGQEADTRLDLVLAVHPGWLGLEQDMLNGPLWVAENPENNLPSFTYFDSYATTGYFSGDLGYGDKAAIVLGWIAESESLAIADADSMGLSGAARDAYIAEHRYDHAVELAIQELRDGSVTGDPANTLEQLISTSFVYHGDVAEQHGLDLIMYEGGTHVVGVGQWVGNQTLTDFFVHLNFTDEMGELYNILLEGWRDAGGTMFNMYEDVRTPGQYGSFGNLRHLLDENSRWDAIVDFNTNNPAWWEEERSPDAFIGTSEASGPTGVLEVGTDGDDGLRGGLGNDTLEGGAGVDWLYGGAGDDVLRGGSDTDALFGDAGDDLMEGGAGDDGIDGGTGADTLDGGIGIDWLYGGDDSDVLRGGSETDALFGDAGDDLLEGGAGDDGLDGGIGNDTMEGGAGVDWLYGSFGDDLLHGAAMSQDSADTDALFGQEGNDTLYGGGGGDNLDGGLGADVLHGGAGADWLFGQEDNDILFGDDGSDVLFGNTGDDALSGGAEGDALDGGAGNDTLDGGAGVDILFGGADADVFLFKDASEGEDLIRDFVTGEDVIQLDAAAFGITGGSLTGQGVWQMGNGLPADFGTTGGPVLYFDTLFNALFYDADGGTTENAVALFALETGTLVETDIWVL
jgi:Ca2+-binding RTX toxin-like protein